LAAEDISDQPLVVLLGELGVNARFRKNEK
jgi:hypothetical protein